MQAVLRLRDAAFKHVAKRGKFRLDAGVRLQCRLRCIQPGECAAVLPVAFQRGAGGVCGVDERLRVGKARVLRAQLVPFVFFGVESLHVLDLPEQPLALFGQRFLRFACLGKCVLRALPCVPKRGERSGVHAAVAIEQRAHGGRPCEALPGVLPVDVHQPRAQRAQLPDGGGRATYPRAAFAGGVYRAAQQQRFVAAVVKAFFAQPLLRSGGQGVKAGGDFAARLAFAHPERIATRTQQELQRVDEYGFARARLTRERGKARRQFQIKLRNDDEIAQTKRCECHGLQCPAFQ